MASTRRLRILTVAGPMMLSVLFPFSALASTAGTPYSHFSPQMLVRVESSSIVYVVGSVSCTRAPCLRLLRTDNDGASFAEVTLPPTTAVQGSPVGSLDQIVFANAEDGYALEGSNGGEGVPQGTVLYATFNGARTWEKVTEPQGSGLSRLAVSSSALYGVTMHCSKQPNGNEGCLDYRLVHASLSAERWTSSPIPNGGAYAWGFLGNVAAYGPMVWLTEGAKWSLLATSRDHGAVFRTLTPKFPALASVAGCDLTAFSTSTLWAACPTGMAVSFSYSNDAGTQWTAVPTDQFMGTGGGFFDPVSSTLAYLDYGGPRPLYRVNDLGRHLTKVGTLSCSKVNSSINAMAFTGERSGLAICLPEDNWSSAQLKRTTDGGATWTRIVP